MTPHTRVAHPGVVQCAAVTTHCFSTNTPPQYSLYMSKMAACHGCEWGSQSRPPTTRVSPPDGVTARPGGHVCQHRNTYVSSTTCMSAPEHVCQQHNMYVSTTTRVLPLQHVCQHHNMYVSTGTRMSAAQHVCQHHHTCVATTTCMSAP